MIVYREIDKSTISIAEDFLAFPNKYKAFNPTEMSNLTDGIVQYIELEKLSDKRFTRHSMNSECFLICSCMLCLGVMKYVFKGEVLPHSWNDINPEINCSQMLHSARIYQCLHTNVLRCIQTILSKNYIGSVIMQPSQTRLSCTERKPITLLLVPELKFS